MCSGNRAYGSNTEPIGNIGSCAIVPPQRSVPVRAQASQARFEARALFLAQLWQREMELVHPRKMARIGCERALLEVREHARQDRVRADGREVRRVKAPVATVNARKDLAAVVDVAECATMERVTPDVVARAVLHKEVS